MLGEQKEWIEFTNNKITALLYHVHIHVLKFTSILLPQSRNLGFDFSFRLSLFFILFLKIILSDYNFCLNPADHNILAKNLNRLFFFFFLWFGLHLLYCASTANVDGLFLAETLLRPFIWQKSKLKYYMYTNVYTALFYTRKIV